MPTTKELRNTLIQELKDLVAKKRALIKESEGKARDEKFLKSTVTGGLFSQTARYACDQRADAAKRRADWIRKEIVWHEEMLKKYSD